MLLMELQTEHLQAHLSFWLPDRSRLTKFMSMWHLLQVIRFAKRWRACNHSIVFIIPSAEESVNTYGVSAETLMSQYSNSG